MFVPVRIVSGSLAGAVQVVVRDLWIEQLRGRLDRDLDRSGMTAGAGQGYGAMFTRTTDDDHL
ncbi:hypothetical protein DBR42_00220 [Pelomonas sp. HMWF004]|nr:hypothetical protein DBR42_00220 [Pelomonas sp. HMWF004]